MSIAHAPVKLAFSISGAVTATGIGRSRLYQEMAAGKLRAFKLGRRTLISADELGAWLTSYQNAER